MKYIVVCLWLWGLLSGKYALAQNVHITDSLLAVLKSMPEDTNKINTLRTLFNEYRYSDFLKAENIAQQELTLALKLNYPYGEAMAYRHLGIACSSQSKSVKAIEYYLKAGSLYEKIKDRFFVAACYNNIGSVYMDLKQWNKAKENLNKAIRIWQPLENGQEGIAIALSNLGGVYNALDQKAIAIESYKKAIVIGNKIGLPQAIGEAETNIASIYIDQKDYATASVYLAKAHPIALQTLDNEVLTQIYYYQSKIAVAQNKIEEALSKTNQSLALAKQISSGQWVVKCYKQLAQLYELKGNDKQVAHFQSLYIAMHDSLDSAEQTLLVEKLQYEYQLKNKDLITQSLLKDKKLKEEERAQDETKKKGGIALTLLFIATTVFYRIIYQRQKKMNQVMVLQQQEIQGQNEEIKQQNEQILLQRENLAKANVALNKLFSIISHDLRAPFRSIKGIIGLFNEQLLDAEEMQDATRKLSDRVNTTSELLDNLLLWSKSQLKGFEVHRQYFEIKDVIHKSVGMLDIVASQKQIHLAIEVPSSLNVYADPDMVDTILRNLVANAIKFSEQNNTVWIRATEQETDVAISVQDNGMGIDLITQETILNPTGFYSTLGTTGETGTGLGLYLCLEFLALNYGALSIKSEVGQGSTFTFTLPKRELS